MRRNSFLKNDVDRRGWETSHRMFRPSDDISQSKAYRIDIPLLQTEDREEPEMSSFPDRLFRVEIEKDREKHHSIFVMTENFVGNYVAGIRPSYYVSFAGYWTHE